MKKILFLPSIITFFLSLFFTLGSFNQTFAIGEGETCHSRSNGVDIPNGGCNAGLTCDTRFVDNYPNNCTGTADHGSCAGICRKNCDYYVGDTNNECDTTNEFCHITSPGAGYTSISSGYCAPDEMPHIPTGSICTREVPSGYIDPESAAALQRGNCKEPNDVCDLQLDEPCSGGRCQGRCLPPYNTYTCNASLESRQNVDEIDCPPGYTCNEAAGRSLTRTVDADGGCAFNAAYGGTSSDCTNDVITCPDCQFTCRATAQVQVTCSCSHPGSPIDGENEIICRNSEKTEKVFCEEVGVACYATDRNTLLDPYSISERDFNDLTDAFPGHSLRGVMCRTPDQYQQYLANQTPPIPPAPPCLSNLDATGGMCLEILTAFGSIGTEPAAFITSFFSILLGAAGSIALILFMRAGYQIMSARGNPEGIKEGREKLVAAILGLMFIIFSFVLLEVIGVDLLRLPNAGRVSTSCTVGIGGGQGTCNTGQTCVSSTGTACTGGVCAGTCQ